MAKSSLSSSPSSNPMFGFHEYGFPIIFFRGFRNSCLAFWYSPLRSSRITLEFSASTAISFPPLFRNTMKVLPLSSPKVMSRLLSCEVRSIIYAPILRSDCLEEALATSSSNVAVAPTVNFLFGRQAEARKRRHKQKKVQVRKWRRFILSLGTSKR